jgi:hypothetical protein
MGLARVIDKLIGFIVRSDKEYNHIELSPEDLDKDTHVLATAKAHELGNHVRFVEEEIAQSRKSDFETFTGAPFVYETPETTRLYAELDEAKLQLAGAAFSRDVKSRGIDDKEIIRISNKGKLVAIGQYRVGLHFFDAVGTIDAVSMEGIANVQKELGLKYEPGFLRDENNLNRIGFLFKRPKVLMAQVPSGYKNYSKEDLTGLQPFKTFKTTYREPIYERRKVKRDQPLELREPKTPGEYSASWGVDAEYWHESVQVGTKEVRYESFDILLSQLFHLYIESDLTVEEISSKGIITLEENTPRYGLEDFMDTIDEEGLTEYEVFTLKELFESKKSKVGFESEIIEGDLSELREGRKILQESLNENRRIEYDDNEQSHRLESLKMGDIDPVLDWLDKLYEPLDTYANSLTKAIEHVDSRIRVIYEASERISDRDKEIKARDPLDMGIVGTKRARTRHQNRLYISPSSILKLVQENIYPHLPEGFERSKGRNARTVDKETLRDAYFKWADSVKLPYNGEEFDSREIAIGNGWKPVSFTKSGNNGTTTFTHNGTVFNGWYRKTNPVSSTFDSFVEDVGRYVTWVPTADWEKSYHWSTGVEEVTKAASSQLGKQSLYVIEEQIRKVRSRSRSFRDIYTKIIHPAMDSLSQLAPEGSSYPDMDSLRFKFKENYQGFFVTQNSERLTETMETMFDYFLGSYNEHEIDFDTLAQATDLVFEIQESIGPLDFMDPNFKEGFTKYFNKRCKENPLLKKTMGKILDGMGWGAQSALPVGGYVPDSNDMGTKLSLRYQVAESIKEPNLVSLMDFFDAVKEYAPQLFEKVQNKLNLTFTEINEVSGIYQSTVAYTVVEDMDRAILKITQDPTMVMDHIFLSKAKNHPELNGICASPISPLGKDDGWLFDLRANAFDLKSGYDVTGFVDDPILHLLAIAAKLHTWGDELFESGGIKGYDYRSMENHQADIQRLKENNKNIGYDSVTQDKNVLHKLVQIYETARGYMSDSDAAEVVTLRDFRTDNVVNGLVVDAGSVSLGYAQWDIARLFMDSENSGLIEDLNEDAKHYYLAWYNLLRTAETNKRLGSNENSTQDYIEFVNMKDLNSGFIVEAQYVANTARDRSDQGLDVERSLYRVNEARIAFENPHMEMVSPEVREFVQAAYGHQIAHEQARINVSTDFEKLKKDMVRYD